MLHFFTEDACAPHVTGLSEGKRVILKPKQNPSRPLLFLLVRSPLLIIPLAKSSNYSEILKSHASIEELTLKRRRSSTICFFVLARKILTKRVRVRVHFDILENLKKNWRNFFKNSTKKIDENLDVMLQFVVLE